MSPQQGYHPQRGYQCHPKQDASTERHQCYLEQGCFYRGISATTSKDAPAKASVLSINYLRAGVSDQEHQCSISIGILILLNNVWMTPDVVPTRTIHHRFLILKKPSNWTMYLCPWCKDKSTWRRSIVYIVETGITVFEVN